MTCLMHAPRIPSIRSRRTVQRPRLLQAPTGLHRIREEVTALGPIPDLNEGPWDDSIMSSSFYFHGQILCKLSTQLSTYSMPLWRRGGYISLYPQVNHNPLHR